MRSETRTSLCPSRFCSAHNPVQGLVSKAQSELVNEPALEGAILCAACGCVWVRDQVGRAHILGTLRREGRSYQWKTPYRSGASAG